jgi:hypothetical protein
MKILIKLFIALLISLFIIDKSLAQIPSYSFENWSADSPDGWITNNISGFLTPVTKSNVFNSGASSAKMEMMTSIFGLLQPVLNAGPLGIGIPISTRFSTINFYYKYAPTASTVYFVMSVSMMKGGQYIGGAAGKIKNTAATFTKFSVPISYLNSQVPDAATIYITLIDSFLNASDAGTYALIDDIYFDQLSDVSEIGDFPKEFSLEQNYPNPFNPSTKICWQIPIGGWQTLKVYDLLGNETATLVNEYRPAGTYEIEFEAAAIPTGVYFYQLKAENFIETKKMILLR